MELSILAPEQDWNVTATLCKIFPQKKVFIGICPLERNRGLEEMSHIPAHKKKRKTTFRTVVYLRPDIQPNQTDTHTRKKTYLVLYTVQIFVSLVLNKQ